MPATSLREPSQVLDPSRAGGSPLAPPSPTLPITPPSSALADEASESAFGGQLRTHEVTLTGNETETICCLYLVAGLPKQTATWTTLSLASDPALSKLQHRPGAVGEWWRAEALGTNVASAAPAVDRGVSGDADKQQVKLCEKALKYAFPREVEILRSTVRPEATSHTFSFELQPSTQLSSGRSSGLRGADSDTYHGVTLTVYSVADEAKRSAIRKALSSRAAAISFRSQAFILNSDSTTDDRSDYWLPYALTLVSKMPLYSLMDDYLKMSWARFSKDVGAHSRQMALALKTPVPRIGGLVRLIVFDSITAPERSNDAVELVAPLPRLDLNVGLQTAGWAMPPLLQVLSLPNLLMVLDIALSNAGKVVLVSAFPALLAPCVLTLEYLCELRGSWPGIAQPLVHSRDIPLFLDDQGPFILGVNVECKYIAKLGPDVCIVDLDINFVNCPSPPIGLPSQQQRAKALVKLRKTLGEGFMANGGAGVPPELRQAYPDGRLKPHCELQLPTGALESFSIEQAAAPTWWNQSQVILAFEQMLAEQKKKPSLLKRLSSSSMPKVKPLTETELVGRVAMRRRTLQFIETRDEMESKLGRLSRRLGFLVHETEIWKERFTHFEALTERLGLEADDLRRRIDKECRESRRLSSQLGDHKKEQLALQQKLEATEEARLEALAEMAEMAAKVKRIELDHDTMVANLDSQLDSALDRLSVDFGSSVAVSRAGSTTTLSVGRKSPSSSSPPVSRQGSLLARRALADQLVNGASPTSGGGSKRFSATVGRSPAKTDALSVLDATISTRSTVVEERMAAIQSKLDIALESMTAYHARSSTENGLATSSAAAGAERQDEHADHAGLAESFPVLNSRPPTALAVTQVPAADAASSDDSAYSEGDDEGTTLRHLTPSPDLRDCSPTDKACPCPAPSAPAAAFTA